jgi:hypothetical protein
MLSKQCFCKRADILDRKNSPKLREKSFFLKKDYFATFEIKSSLMQKIRNGEKSCQPFPRGFDVWKPPLRLFAQMPFL